MNSKELTSGIVWAVVQLLLGALLIWILWQLQSLIVYIAIAAVMSLIGRPINKFLAKKLHFSNLLSTVVTLLVLLGALTFIISLFVPLLIHQGENLSLLDVDSLKEKVAQLIEQISIYFQLDSRFWDQQLSTENLFKNVNLSLLPEFLNQILEILGGFTIGLFSVLFILFFFLKDSNMLERSILTLVNNKVEGRVAKSFEKIKNLLSRYFLGLLLQISILLIIYSLVLFIFGIENAFVIAFLCALLNLIPYLGPIIGGILMLLLTMNSNIDADFSTVILPKTIYVMIGFIVGQLIDNFFSQPIIFSNSVKSHPLEIFIVILASGTLFGPVGMIVAVPTYTAIKVVLQEFLAANKIVRSLTKDF